MIAVSIGITWIAALLLCLADGRRKWVGWTAVGAIGAALVVLATLTPRALDGDPAQTIAGGWPEGVGITLRADALGLVFALVSALVLMIALAHQVLRGIESRAFPAVVLFMATGLTGLFLTGDIFSFFVFFELSMIASYVLTGYGGRTREIRGAFVFAVINLMGSFIFLIGVAALYHVTGTLDMVQISQRISDVDPGATVLIAVSFLIAFGVKLGLFPFHFWLPLVYTAARPAVVAMLAGALTNIGSYGLLRFGVEILPRELQMASTALMVLGAATVLYGGLQAISCRSTSEMLAFSSIGQVGYVLLALGIGGPVGIAAAVLYAVVNSLNKLLLFLSIGARGWLVGAAVLVGAFSVAGVPPSSGFLAKLAVIDAAVVEGSVAIVVLIVAGSALSFIYMFQTFQKDHWEDAPAPTAHRTLAEQAMVGLVACLVLVLGLWPEPLLLASAEGAAALGLR